MEERGWGWGGGEEERENLVKGERERERERESFCSIRPDRIQMIRLQERGGWRGEGKERE